MLYALDHLAPSAAHARPLGSSRTHRRWTCGTPRALKVSRGAASSLGPLVCNRLVTSNQQVVFSNRRVGENLNFRVNEKLRRGHQAAVRGSACSFQVALSRVVDLV